MFCSRIYLTQNGMCIETVSWQPASASTTQSASQTCVADVVDRRCVAVSTCRTSYIWNKKKQIQINQCI